jgi:hypothetical protein
MDSQERISRVGAGKDCNGQTGSGAYRGWGRGQRRDLAWTRKLRAREARLEGGGGAGGREGEEGKRERERERRGRAREKRKESWMRRRRRFQFATERERERERAKQTEQHHHASPYNKLYTYNYFLVCIPTLASHSIISLPFHPCQSASLTPID